jgi:small subunit ribosomal protein S4e
MAHLKRSEMPVFWPLPRKNKKFAVCPVSGPHPKGNCIPLNVVVRDVMGMCKTAKEAKKIVKSKEVLVDGKEILEERFPIGAMDIITLKGKKESFMAIPDKKGFEFRKIEDKKSGSKYCKIIGKRLLKKGLQLNLHDGRNILLDAKEKDKYNVGDSVKVSFKEGKAEKVYPYKEGAEVVILKGVNRGKTGKIKEILVKKDLQPPKAKIELDGEDKIFARDLVFVVPKKE